MSSNATTFGNKIGNAASNTISTSSNMMRSGYNRTRNAASRAYASFGETNIFIKIFIIVLILVIVIGLIYWVIYAINIARYNAVQSPFIITEPVNAYDSRISGHSITLPTSSDGLTFTYSLWIYVADWNYLFGKWKNIFVKGTPNGSNRFPGLWLYPKTNALHARINTYADPNEGCDIQNIPLQKWVHIVYVLNNRTVDIYIDGKLERSCVLRGVPKMNNDPLYLAQDGGFFGQMSKMQYFTRSLNPSEISQLYSEGPYITDRMPSAGRNNNKIIPINDNSNCVNQN